MGIAPSRRRFLGTATHLDHSPKSKAQTSVTTAEWPIDRVVMACLPLNFVRSLQDFDKTRLECSPASAKLSLSERFNNVPSP